LAVAVESADRKQAEGADLAKLLAANERLAGAAEGAVENPKLA
jgi:hypothetical protein